MEENITMSCANITNGHFTVMLKISLFRLISAQILQVIPAGQDQPILSNLSNYL